MLARKKDRHIFVIIAIGSNLPAADGSTPLQTCHWAVGAIARLAGVTGLVRARWYASAAQPAGSGPPYVNGAVHFNLEATPASLLAALQAIEHQAGRTRPAPNAPRTLDLDIIDMGGQVRAAPDPILPHPAAHRRAFVLHPLRDLAPNWTHPVTRQSVHTLLATLPPQDIHPL